MDNLVVFSLIMTTYRVPACLTRKERNESQNLNDITMGITKQKFGLENDNLTIFENQLNFCLEAFHVRVHLQLTTGFALQIESGWPIFNEHTFNTDRQRLPGDVWRPQKVGWKWTQHIVRMSFLHVCFLLSDGRPCLWASWAVSWCVWASFWLLALWSAALRWRGWEIKRRLHENRLKKCILWRMQGLHYTRLEWTVVAR